MQLHFATDCVSPTCCHHHPIAFSSVSRLVICQQTDPPPAQLHTATQILVMSHDLLHFNYCCTLQNRRLLWSVVKVGSGLQMLHFSTTYTPSFCAAKQANKSTSMEQMQHKCRCWHKHQLHGHRPPRISHQKYNYSKHDIMRHAAHSND